MSTDQPHNDGTSLDIASQVDEKIEALQGDIREKLLEQLNAGLAASDLDSAFADGRVFSCAKETSTSTLTRT